MIFFFDKALAYISHVEEVGFSYNKKANSEGSGKIEVLELPPKKAMYLIIQREGENVASGYICEYSTSKKGYNISFKTLEAVLKNTKTPKGWKAFNARSLREIILSLFHSYGYIYLNTRNQLSRKVNMGGALVASYNLLFNRLEGGELHLSFEESQLNKNNFYFVQNGWAIYTFDLSTGNNLKSAKDGLILYAIRYRVSIGSKTYITVKTTTSSKPFDVSKILNGSEEIAKKFKEDTFKEAGSDIRRMGESGEGDIIEVSSLSTDRYLAICLEFEYRHPNYTNDFHTQEVYDSSGNKQKRTVRGFTPILHGMEIIYRTAMPPISLNGRQYTENLFLPPFFSQTFCNYKDTKIKMDDATHLDILNNLARFYEFNFSFDLRFNDQDYSRAVLGFWAWQKDARALKKDGERPPFYAVDRSERSEDFLQHGSGAYFFDNFSLKDLKKSIPIPITLHCKGAGTELEAPHCTLFYIWKDVVGGGRVSKIYVSSSDGVEWQALQGTGALFLESDAEVAEIFRLTPFIEESFEDSEAKDASSLVRAGIKYIKEHYRGVDRFEVETANPRIRLYDYVRLLHGGFEKSFSLEVKEEKIAVKDGRLTKTLGIGGTLFNPFDSLFEKEGAVESKKIIKPVQFLKAVAQDTDLFITWEGRGVWERFCVRIVPMWFDDGSPTSSGIESEALWEAVGFEDAVFDKNVDEGLVESAELPPHPKNEHNVATDESKIYYKYKDIFTTEQKLLLKDLPEQKLFRIGVYSELNGEKAEWRCINYVFLQKDKGSIKMLNSLEEKTEEGDRAFYLPKGARTKSKKDFLSQYAYVYEDVFRFNLVDTFELVYDKSFFNKPSPPYWNEVEALDDIPEHPEYKEIKERFDRRMTALSLLDEEAREGLHAFFGEYYVFMYGAWRRERLQRLSKPEVYFDFSNVHEDATTAEGFFDGYWQKGLWKNYNTTLYYEFLYKRIIDGLAQYYYPQEFYLHNSGFRWTSHKGFSSYERFVKENYIPPSLFLERLEKESGNISQTSLSTSSAPSVNTSLFSKFSDIKEDEEKFNKIVEHYINMLREKEATKGEPQKVSLKRKVSTKDKFTSLFSQDYVYEREKENEKKFFSSSKVKVNEKSEISLKMEDSFFSAESKSFVEKINRHNKNPFEKYNKNHASTLSPFYPYVLTDDDLNWVRNNRQDEYDHRKLYTFVEQAFLHNLTRFKNNCNHFGYIEPTVSVRPELHLSLSNPFFYKDYPGSFFMNGKEFPIKNPIRFCYLAMDGGSFFGFEDESTAESYRNLFHREGLKVSYYNFDPIQRQYFPGYGANTENTMRYVLNNPSISIGHGQNIEYHCEFSNGNFFLCTMGISLCLTSNEGYSYTQTSTNVEIVSINNYFIIYLYNKAFYIGAKRVKEDFSSHPKDYIPMAKIDDSSSWHHICVAFAIAGKIENGRKIATSLQIRQLYVDGKAHPHVYKVKHRQPEYYFLIRFFAYRKIPPVVKEGSYEDYLHKRVPPPVFYNTQWDISIAYFAFYDYRPSYWEMQYMKEHPIYNPNGWGALPSEYPGSGVGGGGVGESGASPSGHYLGFASPPKDANTNGIHRLSDESTRYASNGDFFLSCKYTDFFKAGVVYKWVGGRWTELLPAEKYGKEYEDALEDMKNAGSYLTETSVRPFSIESLFLSAKILSKNLKSESVQIANLLQLLNVREGDPHIKGAVYSLNGVLMISKG